MPTHAERCQRESTRDVVFLFQWHPSKFSKSDEWLTESVWFDRDEAEAFAKAHEYNYCYGWRVYGVPSYGQLAELLKSQDTVSPTKPQETDP